MSDNFVKLTQYYWIAIVLSSFITFMLGRSVLIGVGDKRVLFITVLAAAVFSGIGWYFMPYLIKLYMG